MHLEELERIVRKRLEQTNSELQIPSVVKNYIENDDYEKLMKYFKTFCFVRKWQCKRNYQYLRSENTLKHKLGKCGALSQLCYHMLKQCKKEVYFVAANFDHAWVIVRKGDDLISLDPSDGTVNNWHYTTPDKRIRSIYMFGLPDNNPIPCTNLYTISKR